MHSLCRCLCLLSSWLCLRHSMRNLGLLGTHCLLSAVRWRLSSRLPLVRRLVVVSHVVACLCCVNFCLAAASRIYPQPTFFIHASWLSRRTSPHHLHLLTCCHLTTGCVLPSPMCGCRCFHCAGVFAVVAIVIVTLVAYRRRCRAGVIALIVVIVVDVHTHHQRQRIPLRHCHCH